MKLLVTIIILGTFSFATSYINSLNMVSNNIETSQSQKQRDIRTKSDFYDFVSALQEAMNMGQINPYSYLLGMTYMNDITVKDGVIKKDINKAKYYLQISYDDGNYAAVYLLSMILVGQTNYDQALFLLDKAIQKLKTDKKIDPYKAHLSESFLATTFATIVLQYKFKDKEAVDKAINIMESSQNNAPTALFILANLYHLSGLTQKANLFLNRSCKTQGMNKDPKLDRICSQFIINKDK